MKTTKNTTPTATGQQQRRGASRRQVEATIKTLEANAVAYERAGFPVSASRCWRLAERSTLRLEAMKGGES